MILKIGSLEGPTRVWLFLMFLIKIIEQLRLDFLQDKVTLIYLYEIPLHL